MFLVNVSFAQVKFLDFEIGKTSFDDAQKLITENIKHIYSDLVLFPTLRVVYGLDIFYVYHSDSSVGDMDIENKLIALDVTAYFRQHEWRITLVFYENILYKVVIQGLDDDTDALWQYADDSFGKPSYTTEDYMVWSDSVLSWDQTPLRIVWLLVNGKEVLKIDYMDGTPKVLDILQYLYKCVISFIKK